jgi:hypothetical protein
MVEQCSLPKKTEKVNYDLKKIWFGKENQIINKTFAYRSPCCLFFGNCHRGPISGVQTPAYQSTAKSNPRAEFAEKQSVRAPSYVIYPYFWLAMPE